MTEGQLRKANNIKKDIDTLKSFLQSLDNCFEVHIDTIIDYESKEKGQVMCVSKSSEIYEIISEAITKRMHELEKQFKEL